jgi:hypothetical protein
MMQTPEPQQRLSVLNLDSLPELLLVDIRLPKSTYLGC